MPSEWQEVTVEDACSLVVDCPHSTPVWTESGVVVIRNTYLKNGRMDLSNPSYTDEEHYLDRVRRAVPQAGDLVISREAPIGEIAMIPEGLRACLGQRVVLLRPNDSICDGKFLLYSFIGGELRDEIMSHEGTGSTVSNLRIPSLKAAKVKLPPLPIQRQIAAILSAFDDKIELNRQMNRTLEQMARALFKSWFVDFDPVRAKMRGEQPEGMDAATAALFPSELVEVDGREVPKGWDIVKARNFAEISIGKTPPRKEPEWFSFEQGHRVWVSIKDMGSQGVYISDSSEYLTEEAVSKFNIKRVPNNSVLLSFKLTIGRVKITRGEIFTNEAIAHFSLNKAYKSTYCYFVLSNYDFSSLGSTSSIATAVNSQIIKDMPLLMPPNELLMTFDDAVLEIMQRIEVGEAESARLAQLRDALLPMLLSGEVDVSEWAAPQEQGA